MMLLMLMLMMLMLMMLMLMLIDVGTKVYCCTSRDASRRHVDEIMRPKGKKSVLRRPLREFAMLCYVAVDRRARIGLTMP